MSKISSFLLGLNKVKIPPSRSALEGEKTGFNFSALSEKNRIIVCKLNTVSLLTTYYLLLTTYYLLLTTYCLLPFNLRFLQKLLLI